MVTLFFRQSKDAFLERADGHPLGHVRPALTSALDLLEVARDPCAMRAQFDVIVRDFIYG